MANTVSSLSYANTFGDWVVTTNSLVRENNTLAANNYTKNTGTLFLSDPSLGLQVANNAIIGGQLQSTGIGSSATIQNSLTVGGNTSLANTTVTGLLSVSGTLSVNGNTVDPVYINSINALQNTQISAVNSYAASAYGVANTAGTTAASALTLATTDAANIILVNQYAASGYALSNTNANNIVAVNNFAQGAYNQANSVVLSITGTANEITATSSTGAITLSTPQAIATGSSVQFGSFGVGTAASGTTGEIRATNNVTAYYSSDIKFKENVRDIPNALETVESIGGKLFDWNDEYIKEHGGEDGYFIQKEDFGVIAQDVQKVFPVAVRTRPDGSLAVDYEKLSALAFAAVAELSTRVKSLEARI